MPPTSAKLRRALLPLLALLVAVGVMAPPAGAANPAPLTNLAHLDFLGDRVDPPDQAGHTTWRLDQEPEIGVLWTYAEPQPDGSYRRLGGGTYDPATNTWGQGAFNADDMTRAAVVYLRHWRQFGDQDSRDQAYQLLRGVTYLQTSSGPDAGNVVLWMQPDGTLNPSPTPTEEPDPSDSGPSYWLARTIWALGEGYAAFRGADPAFAGFLRERLELSTPWRRVCALRRRCPPSPGGLRRPQRRLRRRLCRKLLTDRDWLPLYYAGGDRAQHLFALRQWQA